VAVIDIDRECECECEGDKGVLLLLGSFGDLGVVGPIILEVEPLDWVFRASEMVCKVARKA